MPSPSDPQLKEKMAKILRGHNIQFMILAIGFVLIMAIIVAISIIKLLQ